MTTDGDDDAAGESTAAAPRDPSARSPADLLFPDLDEELGLTRRMLEIAPSEPADWRPHQKSMTLAELATHVAELPGFPNLMLIHDELDHSGDFAPGNVADTDERLAIFDEAAQQLRSLVDELTWERALSPWVMRIDGDVVLRGPRAQLVRRLGISHIAHHRAQLGVYLRQLDIPIIGPYGPSADES